MKSITSKPFRFTFLLTAIFALLDVVIRVLLVESTHSTAEYLSNRGKFHFFGIELIIVGVLLLTYVGFILIYEHKLKKPNIKILDKIFYILLIAMLMLDCSYRSISHYTWHFHVLGFSRTYHFLDINIIEIMVIMLSFMFLLYNLYRNYEKKDINNKITDNVYFKHLLVPFVIALLSWFLTYGIHILYILEASIKHIQTHILTFKGVFGMHITTMVFVFLFVFVVIECYYRAISKKQEEKEEIVIKNEKIYKYAFFSVLISSLILVLIRGIQYFSQDSGTNHNESFFRILYSDIYNKRKYFISFFRTEFLILLGISLVFIIMVIIRKISKTKMRFYGPLYFTLIFGLIFDFVQETKEMRMIASEIRMLSSYGADIKINLFSYLPELIIIIVSLICVVLAKNILNKKIKTKLEIATDISQDFMLSLMALISIMGVFVGMGIRIEDKYINTHLKVALIMQAVVILIFIVLKTITVIKQRKSAKQELIV